MIIRCRVGLPLPSNNFAIHSSDPNSGLMLFRGLNVRWMMTRMLLLVAVTVCSLSRATAAETVAVESSASKADLLELNLSPAAIAAAAQQGALLAPIGQHPHLPIASHLALPEDPHQLLGRKPAALAVAIGVKNIVFPPCSPQVAQSLKDELGIAKFWNLWNISDAQASSLFPATANNNKSTDATSYPCTIFAVSDAGLEKPPGLYLRLTENPFEATEFVASHILARPVSLQRTDKYPATLKSIGGLSLKPVYKDGVLFINNTKVTASDVQLPSGGVVHVLAEPLCCTSPEVLPLTAALNATSPNLDIANFVFDRPSISYLRRGHVLPKSNYTVAARRLTLARGPSSLGNGTDGITRYIYHSPASIWGISGPAGAGSLNDSLYQALPGLSGTTFITLLQLADCRTNLKGGDPLTVFMPTDEALASLPPRDIQSLLSNPEKLRQTLLYHIAPGAFTSGDLNTNVSITTVEGKPLRIDTYGNTTLKTVERAKVILSDIIGHNGVIHIIDRFLYPVPNSTLWHMCEKIPSLSQFLSLLKRCNLTDYLKGEEPYTIFAPTDDALKNLTSSIPSTPEGDEKLRVILLNHIVPGTVYTASWAPAQTLPTAGKHTIYLQYQPNESGGFSLLPNGATVFKSDLGATNGVLHIINQVMPIDYVPAAEPRRTFWQDLWKAVFDIFSKKPEEPKVPPEELPKDDIISTLKKLPNAKEMLDALNITNMLDILEKDGPFTIFVPVNSAFGQLKRPFSEIAAENPDVADDVLKSHIVSQQLSCEDMIRLKKIKSLENVLLLISSSIKGCAKVDNSDILYWNITAKNGNIYLIDQILRADELLPEEIIPTTEYEVITTTAIELTTEELLITTEVSIPTKFETETEVPTTEKITVITEVPEVETTTSLATTEITPVSTKVPEGKAVTGYPTPEEPIIFLPENVSEMVTPRPEVNFTVTVPTGETLLDVLRKLNLTTFPNLLNLTHVDTTLPQNLTIFAPTDEAFNNVDVPTMDNLFNNPEQLRRVILYHFVPVLIPGEDLRRTVQATTLEGVPVFITIYLIKGMPVPLLNNATISPVQYKFNGIIIYLINKVLISPPEYDIYTTIAKTLKEQKMTDYITKASADPLLTGVLTGMGPITVFVPSDKAWSKLPDDVQQQLTTNATALTDYIASHIVQGAIFTPVMVEGATFKTINGKILTVTHANGYIKINNAIIIQPDIVAKNGVIHVIDMAFPVYELPHAEIVTPATVATTISPVTPTSTALVTEVTSEAATVITSEIPVTEVGITEITPEVGITEATTEAPTTETAITKVTYEVPLTETTITEITTETPSTEVGITEVTSEVPVTEVGITEITTELPTTKIGVTEAVTEIVPENVTTVYPVTEPEVLQMIPALRKNNLTILADLLESIFAQKILNLYGLFTLFAPTNKAFEELPPEKLDKLKSNPQALQQMLLYNVISRILPFSDISDNLKIPSIQGTNLTFHVYDDGRIKTVLGSRIIKPDIIVLNGMVHIIDKLLYPIPRQPLLQVVDSDFPSFSKAINNSQNRPTLKDKDVTVFVPSEAFWAGLPQPVRESTLSNTTLMNDLVKNHVCYGRIFKVGIHDGFSCISLSGKTLNFTVIDDTYYVQNVPIIIFDIIDTDGVIHVIDRPLFLETPDYKDIIGLLPPTRPPPRRTTTAPVTVPLSVVPEITTEELTTATPVSEVTTETTREPEVTTAYAELTTATLITTEREPKVLNITVPVSELPTTISEEATTAVTEVTSGVPEITETPATSTLYPVTEPVTETAAPENVTEVVTTVITEGTTPVSVELTTARTSTRVPEETETPTIYPEATSTERLVTPKTTSVPEYITTVYPVEPNATIPHILQNQFKEAGYPIDVSRLTPHLPDTTLYTAFIPYSIYLAGLPTLFLEDLAKNDTAVGEAFSNHICPGATYSPDFKNGFTCITLGNKPIRITIQDGKYFCNGFPIIQLDIPAMDGVVHLINGLLFFEPQGITPTPEVAVTTQRVPPETTEPSVTTPATLSPEIITTVVPEISTVAEMTTSTITTSTEIEEFTVVANVTIPAEPQFTEAETTTPALEYTTATQMPKELNITVPSEITTPSVEVTESTIALVTTEVVTTAPTISVEITTPAVTTAKIPAELTTQTEAVTEEVTGATEITYTTAPTEVTEQPTAPVLNETEVTTEFEVTEVTTVTEEYATTERIVETTTVTEYITVAPNDTIASIIQQQFEKAGHVFDITQLPPLPDTHLYTAFIPYFVFLSGVPSEIIQNILTNKTAATNTWLNHICQDATYSREFANGFQCISLGGKPINVTVVNGRYYCNGFPIIQVDIPAMNGVVHIINGLLFFEPEGITPALPTVTPIYTEVPTTPPPVTPIEEKTTPAVETEATTLITATREPKVLTELTEVYTVPTEVPVSTLPSEITISTIGTTESETTEYTVTPSVTILVPEVNLTTEYPTVTEVETARVTEETSLTPTELTSPTVPSVTEVTGTLLPTAAPPVTVETTTAAIPTPAPNETIPSVFQKQFEDAGYPIDIQELQAQLPDIYLYTACIPYATFLSELSANFLSDLTRNTTALNSALLNHICKDATFSRQFGSSYTCTSLGGRPIVFTFHQNQYFCNNFPIIKLDIPTTDGVVHLIRGILFFEPEGITPQALPEVTATTIIAEVTTEVPTVVTVTEEATISTEKEETTPSEVTEPITLEITTTEPKELNITVSPEVTTVTAIPEITTKYPEVATTTEITRPAVTVETTAPTELTTAEISTPAPNDTIPSVIKKQFEDAGYPIDVQEIQSQLPDTYLYTACIPFSTFLLELPVNFLPDLIRNITALNNALLNHICREATFSRQFGRGYTCTSLGGRPIVFTFHQGQYYCNNFPIIKLDIPTMDGVIHFISGILFFEPEGITPPALSEITTGTTITTEVTTEEVKVTEVPIAETVTAETTAFTEEEETTPTAVTVPITLVTATREPKELNITIPIEATTPTEISEITTKFPEVAVTTEVTPPAVTVETTAPTEITTAEIPTPAPNETIPSTIQKQFKDAGYPIDVQELESQLPDIHLYTACIPYSTFLLDLPTNFLIDLTRNATALNNALLNHICRDATFSRQFGSTYTCTSLGGKPIVFTFQHGQYYCNNFPIIKLDIPTVDGVVHLIRGILFFEPEGITPPTLPEITETTITLEVTTEEVKITEVPTTVTVTVEETTPAEVTEPITLVTATTEPKELNITVPTEVTIPTEYPEVAVTTEITPPAVTVETVTTTELTTAEIPTPAPNETIPSTIQKQFEDAGYPIDVQELQSHLPDTYLYTACIPYSTFLLELPANFLPSLTRNTTALNNALLNHICREATFSRQFGSSYTCTSLGGRPILFTLHQGQYYCNNFPIIKLDIPTLDGVVHLISGILFFEPEGITPPTLPEITTEATITPEVTTEEVKITEVPTAVTVTVEETTPKEVTEPITLVTATREPKELNITMPTEVTITTEYPEVAVTTEITPPAVTVETTAPTEVTTAEIATPAPNETIPSTIQKQFEDAGYPIDIQELQSHLPDTYLYTACIPYSAFLLELPANLLSSLTRNTTLLNNALLNHICQEATFSRQFGSSYTCTSLGGKPIVFTFQYGQYYCNNFPIIKLDIPTVDGVVHLIRGILFFEPEGITPPALPEITTETTITPEVTTEEVKVTEVSTAVTVTVEETTPVEVTEPITLVTATREPKELNITVSTEYPEVAVTTEITPPAVTAETVAPTELTTAEIPTPAPNETIPSTIQKQFEDAGYPIDVQELQSHLPDTYLYTACIPYSTFLSELPANLLPSLTRNTTALNNALLNHICHGATFSRQFGSGYTCISLGGRPILFTFHQGQYYCNNFPIIKLDIPTEDGVVHLINGILFFEPEGITPPALPEITTEITITPEVTTEEVKVTEVPTAVTVTVEETTPAEVTEPITLVTATREPKELNITVPTEATTPTEIPEITTEYTEVTVTSEITPPAVTVETTAPTELTTAEIPTPAPNQTIPLTIQKQFEDAGYPIDVQELQYQLPDIYLYTACIPYSTFLSELPLNFLPSLTRNTTALNNALLNHICRGATFSRQFGSSYTCTSLGGRPILFTFHQGQYYCNNFTIIKLDIPTVDGVVHLINGILFFEPEGITPPALPEITTETTITPEVTTEEVKVTEVPTAVTITFEETTPAEVTEPITLVTATREPKELNITVPTEVTTPTEIPEITTEYTEVTVTTEITPPGLTVETTAPTELTTAEIPTPAPNETIPSTIQKQFEDAGYPIDVQELQLQLPDIYLYTACIPYSAFLSELPSNFLPSLTRNTTALNNALLNHICRGATLSRQFGSSYTCTSLGGRPILFTLHQGQYYCNNFPIIKLDIPTLDGIVHLISGILFFEPEGITPPTLPEITTETTIIPEVTTEEVKITEVPTAVMVTVEETTPKEVTEPITLVTATREPKELNITVPTEVTITTEITTEYPEVAVTTEITPPAVTVETTAPTEITTAEIATPAPNETIPSTIQKQFEDAGYPIDVQELQSHLPDTYLYTACIPYSAFLLELPANFLPDLIRNTSALNNALLNHICRDAKFSRQFGSGYTCTSLGGRPIVFTLHQGQYYCNNFPIIKLDIPTIDGVIHLISGILFFEPEGVTPPALPEISTETTIMAEVTTQEVKVTEVLTEMIVTEETTATIKEEETTPAEVTVPVTLVTATREPKELNITAPTEYPEVAVTTEITATTRAVGITTELTATELTSIPTVRKPEVTVATTLSIVPEVTEEITTAAPVYTKTPEIVMETTAPTEVVTTTVVEADETIPSYIKKQFENAGYPVDITQLADLLPPHQLYTACVPYSVYLAELPNDFLQQLTTNTTALTDALLNHICSDLTTFSEQFGSNYTCTSLGGAPVVIIYKNGQYYCNNFPIIHLNIPTLDGVVHLISGILSFEPEGITPPPIPEVTTVLTTATPTEVPSVTLPELTTVVTEEVTKVELTTLSTIVENVTEAVETTPYEVTEETTKLSPTLLPETKPPTEFTERVTATTEALEATTGTTKAPEVTEVPEVTTAFPETTGPMVATETGIPTTAVPETLATTEFPEISTVPLTTPLPNDTIPSFIEQQFENAGYPIDITDLRPQLLDIYRYTACVPYSTYLSELPQQLLQDLTSNRTATTNALLNHICQGLVYSYQFQNGFTCISLGGKPIILSTKNGQYYCNDFPIIVVDVPAADGVIHIINGLLFFELEGVTPPTIEHVTTVPSVTTPATATISEVISTVPTTRVTEVESTPPEITEITTLITATREPKLVNISEPTLPSVTEETTTTAEAITITEYPKETKVPTVYTEVTTVTNITTPIPEYATTEETLVPTEYTVPSMTTEEATVETTGITTQTPTEFTTVPVTIVPNRTISSIIEKEFEDANYPIDVTELQSNLPDTHLYTACVPHSVFLAGLSNPFMEDLTGNTTAITSALLNHICQKATYSSAFKYGFTCTSLGGRPIIVTVYNGQYYCNGFPIIRLDIPAIDGVVHLIDGLLFFEPEGVTPAVIPTSIPTLSPTTALAEEETTTALTEAVSITEITATPHVTEIETASSEATEATIKYPETTEFPIATEASEATATSLPTTEGVTGVPISTKVTEFIETTPAEAAEVTTVPTPAEITSIIPEVSTLAEVTTVIPEITPNESIPFTFYQQFKDAGYPINTTDLQEHMPDIFLYTACVPFSTYLQGLPSQLLHDLTTNNTAITNALLDHVCREAMYVSQSKDGFACTTLGGKSLIVTRRNGQYFCNQFPVIRVEVPALDGVIYIINGLLFFEPEGITPPSVPAETEAPTTEATSTIVPAVTVTETKVTPYEITTEITLVTATREPKFINLTETPVVPAVTTEEVTTATEYPEETTEVPVSTTSEAVTAITQVVTEGVTETTKVPIGVTTEYPVTAVTMTLSPAVTVGINVTTEYAFTETVTPEVTKPEVVEITSTPFSTVIVESTTAVPEYTTPTITIYPNETIPSIFEQQFKDAGYPIDTTAITPYLPEIYRYTACVPYSTYLLGLPNTLLSELSTNKTATTSALLNHICQGETLSPQFQNPYTCTSLGGSPIILKTVNGQYYCNDFLIIKADVPTADGVVHIISGLLFVEHEHITPSTEPAVTITSVTPSVEVTTAELVETTTPLKEEETTMPEFTEPTTLKIATKEPKELNLTEPTEITTVEYTTEGVNVTVPLVTEETTTSTELAMTPVTPLSTLVPEVTVETTLAPAITETVATPLATLTPEVTTETTLVPELTTPSIIIAPNETIPAVFEHQFETAGYPVNTTDLQTHLPKTYRYTACVPYSLYLTGLPTSFMQQLTTNNTALTNALLNHICQGPAYSPQFKYDFTCSSLGGALIVLSFKNGQYYCNDFPVIKTDMPTSDGVVHIIDGMLFFEPMGITPPVIELTTPSPTITEAITTEVSRVTEPEVLTTSLGTTETAVTLKEETTVHAVTEHTTILITATREPKLVNLTEPTEITEEGTTLAPEYTTVVPGVTTEEVTLPVEFTTVAELTEVTPTEYTSPEAPTVLEMTTFPPYTVTEEVITTEKAPEITTLPSALLNETTVPEEVTTERVPTTYPTVTFAVNVTLPEFTTETGITEITEVTIPTTVRAPEITTAETITFAPNETVPSVLEKEFQQAGYPVDVSELIPRLPDRYLYTAFLPYHTYLLQLPTSVLQDLANNKTAIGELFANHICPEATYSFEFGQGFSCTAIGGQPIVVTVYNGRYFVNGIPIIKVDIPAADGVIHLINGLLFFEFTTPAPEVTTITAKVTESTPYREITVPTITPVVTLTPAVTEVQPTTSPALTTEVTTHIEGYTTILNVTMPAEAQVTEEKETTPYEVTEPVTLITVTREPKVLNITEPTEVYTTLPEEITEITPTVPEVTKYTEATEGTTAEYETTLTPAYPPEYTGITEVSTLEYATTEAIATALPSKPPIPVNETETPTEFMVTEETTVPQLVTENITIPYPPVTEVTGVPTTARVTEYTTVFPTETSPSETTTEAVQVTVESTAVTEYTETAISEIPTTKYPELFNITTVAPEYTSPVEETTVALYPTTSAYPEENITSTIPFYPTSVPGVLSVSIFFYLVDLSGLNLILAQGGPYTILAPVDAAFHALPVHIMTQLRIDIPFLKQVLLYHIIPQRVPSTDLYNDYLLTTLQGQDVRCNIYGPVITLGGAKVIMPDSTSGYDGVLHIVNRVLYPVPVGTVLEAITPRNDTDKVQTLIRNTTLPARLTEPGPFTVFLPSDRALNSLPSYVMDILEHNSTLLEEFILSHMVNGTYYTAGMTEGLELTSLGGQVLRISLAGGLTVNGVPIVSPDISVTNGVVHIIDKILYDPSQELFIPKTTPVIRKDLNVVQLMKQLNLTTFSNLLVDGGLSVNLSQPGYFTVFAPTDDAFAAMPPNQLDTIKADRLRLVQILLYHILPIQIETSQMTNEMVIPSLLPTKSVRLNIYVNNRGPWYTASGSQILMPNNVASNGVVHIVHQVLYIPLGDIVQTVEKCSILQTLRHIIKVSGLEDQLRGGNYTLLAPNDAAFNKLPEDALDRLLVSPHLARLFILGHLLRGTINTEGIFDESTLVTSSNNHLYVRALKDCILLNSAAIQYPDVTADNGVVHVIDRVL